MILILFLSAGRILYVALSETRQLYEHVRFLTATINASRLSEIDRSQDKRSLGLARYRWFELYKAYVINRSSLPLARRHNILSRWSLAVRHDLVILHIVGPEPEA
jgi:hypothetical protein